MPAVKVTVDPVENRGFEYHTGISFTFFARGDPRAWAARRTRARRALQAGEPSAPEPATGFTLYTDTILRTLPEGQPRRRVLIPHDADRARAKALRKEGWTTVAALQPASDWHAEARRLGCGHVLDGGKARPVSENGAEAGGGAGV